MLLHGRSTFTYGQSRKVGKCVPARLVLKPNLPTFRYGQSDTRHGLQKEEHGLQKEEASYCDLPSLLPLVNTVFLSSQRPATPHPGNGHPAPPHARIRGSSGPFVVLSVFEEDTFTVSLGTASTWGKAIPRVVD